MMIDATQLLLSLVIIIIVTMLSVIGVQVYFVLKDLRNTLQKANKILDDTAIISESISKPIGLLSTVAKSLSSGSKIIKLLLGDSTKKPARFRHLGHKL